MFFKNLPNGLRVESEKVAKEKHFKIFFKVSH